MKPKRIVSSVLIFLAAMLVLSACKNGDQSQSSNETSENQSAVSQSESISEQSPIEGVTSEQNEISEVSENDTSDEKKQTESSAERSEKETSVQESSGYVEGSFSTLTREQDEEIKKLEQKYYGHMPYLRATTCGEVDPDAPKLTLEDAKRIIKEAENVDNIMVSINEEWGTENYNQRNEYICQEIKNIQKYPDVTGGSGTTYSEYWLWNDENSVARKQIVLYSDGSTIVYKEIDKDSKTIDDEVLYEASPAENLDVSAENLPVITRPIVPGNTGEE